jgi:hypothetical protein
MPKNKAGWTFLTYIAAHNDLDQFGARTLREIRDVGSTDEVVHGVLYDAHAGATRYVMGDGGALATEQELGSFDSGDPDNLIETAHWLFERHPAHRYGLVLWSHGTGWVPREIAAVAKEARPAASVERGEPTERASAPGSRVLFRSTLRELLRPRERRERAVLFDDGTGHSLDTLELARVTRNVAEAIGQPVDFLGMDACLMGNLEVAYEMRRSVRCLAASPELVPGHSWPYRDIFGAVRDETDRSGADVAELVVDRYVRHYANHPPPAGDVTKVALDLGRLEDLARPVEQLGTSLRADMNRLAGPLWKVQRATRERETRRGARWQSKFNHHLWDLGSLAAGLAASPEVSADVERAANEVRAALTPGAGTVLAEGHYGDWFDATAGVSVYLIPAGSRRVSPWYGRLALAKDTGWGEMLAAYHATVA